MRILFLGLSLFCVQAFAKSDVYVCVDITGKKEFKTTGNVQGCTKVESPGITSKTPREFITKYPDGGDVFLLGKPVKVSSSSRKVWILYDREMSIDNGGKTLYSLMELVIYKCPEKQRGQLRVTPYSEEWSAAEAVLSSNTPMKDVVFKDVVPGTFEDAIFQRVCSAKK